MPHGGYTNMQSRHFMQFIIKYDTWLFPIETTSGILK